MAIIAYGDDYI